MLSHGNLRANLEQTGALPGRLQPDDVVFGVLPLFHVFGLNVTLGLTLAAGAQLVLVDRFDPLAALDIIAAPADHGGGRRAAHVARVGVRARRRPRGDGHRSPRALRRGSSAGATYERIRERFGVRIREGYGLTEAAPTVTSSLGTDAPPGSIGRPLPGIELRVVDDDGDDVFVGDPGEIWVRGPTSSTATGATQRQRLVPSPRRAGCARAISPSSTTTGR